LTWILDRALLVGDSEDTSNEEGVFELPTSPVYDLYQRAARHTVSLFASYLASSLKVRPLSIAFGACDRITSLGLIVSFDV